MTTTEGTMTTNRPTLLPVAPGVKYYVMNGGEAVVGTVSKAYRRDGFHADQSPILYPTPQAAAASITPPLGDDGAEEHFCGSVTCDGGCQERAVGQFDRGQM